MIDQFTIIVWLGTEWLQYKSHPGQSSFQYPFQYTKPGGWPASVRVYNGKCRYSLRLAVRCMP